MVFCQRLMPSRVVLQPGMFTNPGKTPDNLPQLMELWTGYISKQEASAHNKKPVRFYSFDLRHAAEKKAAPIAGATEVTLPAAALDALHSRPVDWRRRAGAVLPRPACMDPRGLHDGKVRRLQGAPAAQLKRLHATIRGDQGHHDGGIHVAAWTVMLIDGCRMPNQRDDMQVE